MAEDKYGHGSILQDAPGLGPYEYIYICIYMKDEIHMERVTYIYRERKRDRERAIKI